MEQPIIVPTSATTKVVKFIDPIEVPAYRMKMLFENKQNPIPILKSAVGPYEKLYASAKTC